jgi:hypothetical protein
MRWLLLLGVAMWGGVAAATEPPWIVRGQDQSLHIDDVPTANPPAVPLPDSTTGTVTPLTPAVTLEGADAATEAEEDEEPRDSETALVFTFIPGSGDDLGLFGFDFRTVPRVDLPQAATLSATTGWGITWLDGPDSTDLPPQLYHVALDIGGVSRVNDEWTCDWAITPAWFTDWVNRRPEAFRLMGRWVSYYHIDSHTQVAAGFTYLNRDDIPALPVVGVIFDDQEAGYRHELVFPRPKLSWRWSDTVESSRWVYASGELGGGSWAIKRFDRTPDVVTLRDYRLLAGLEFRRHRGHRAAVEAGVVFGREIESRTGRGDYSPPTQGIVRLWFDY